MKTILVVEGNSPELVEMSRSRIGMSVAEMYGQALISQDTNTCFRTTAPYEAAFAEAALEDVDGVVFTGSGVPWSADATEAAPLRETMNKAFATGLPVLGSCNGMQLATVVLGGSLRASPNGMEIGLAKDIQLTKAGETHPLLKGRSDGYTVPCVHRDEVDVLPKSAALLGSNSHSPVQAFAYAHGGVDFWGIQYHSEFSPSYVVNLLRSPGVVWKDSENMAEALAHLEDQPEIIEKLGVNPNDLRAETRMTELRNWLRHVDERKKT